MSRLLEMIQEAETIAVLGHVRPDGDCVGSCLAVCSYIREQAPEKTVQVYLEKPDGKFGYLKGFEDISQDAASGISYDLCICLDSGDKERLGAFGVYLDTAKAGICVDHHITNRGYAGENVICPDASSTCEVLCGLLDEERISRETAACIYTGILHDTNVFKNSNTTAKTMEIAGRMMAKGIDFSRIIDESFYKKTYVQNQILGRALLESIVFMDGKCIASYITKKTMDFYGVKPKDLDGIVSQMRVTKGVEVAIFMYETDASVYKVSLRSKEKVDVSRIAAYFGGGGHAKAAGFSMAGTPHDVLNNLAGQMETQLLEEEAEEA